MLINGVLAGNQTANENGVPDVSKTKNQGQSILTCPDETRQVLTTPSPAPAPNNQTESRQLNFECTAFAIQSCASSQRRDLLLGVLFNAVGGGSVTFIRAALSGAQSCPMVNNSSV